VDHASANEIQGIESYIHELKTKIADLNNQLPKHSIPPAMLLELEDLEEALASALKTLESLKHTNA
jgi:hypothetical protein